MRIGLVGYGGWGRVHAAVIARIPPPLFATITVAIFFEHLIEQDRM